MRASILISLFIALPAFAELPMPPPANHNGGTGTAVPEPAPMPRLVNRAHNIENKSWQGLPIPAREGAGVPPKLSESAFVGRGCYNRDAPPSDPVRERDDKNSPQFYHRHPDFTAKVEALGGNGVRTEVKSGPYVIRFSQATAVRPGLWSGKAEVDGWRQVPGKLENEKAKYEVDKFFLETSAGADGKQVQTMTFLTNQPQKTKTIDDAGKVLDVIEENWVKVSSDGHYFQFSVFKNDAGAIIGYYTWSMCGDRFTQGGELRVIDTTFNHATPTQARALAALTSPKPAPLSVPQMPALPDLSNLSPADQSRALDRHLEDVERYRAEIARLRAQISGAPEPKVTPTPRPKTPTLTPAPISR